MLQKSSEFHPRLPAFDLDTASDVIETARQLMHRKMWYQKAGGFVLAATTFLGVPVSMYEADVRANLTASAEASIGINPIAEALDPINNDKANIYVAGVNTKKADYLANSNGRYVQTVADGQTWSIDVDKATLNYAEMGQTIIDEAGIKGVTTVRAVMESAGDGALKAFEYIQAHSDLVVDLWIIISGPDGVDTLRPVSQEQIAAVKQFAWIPGAVDSTWVRRAVELGFRADQFTGGNPFENIGNFIKTNNDITDDLNDNKLTSAKLMSEQMISIETADLETRFKNAGELPNEVVHPTVLYIKVPDDTVVNNPRVVQNLESYADPANIHFFTDTVEGGIHAQASRSKKGYKELFARNKEAIQKSMKVEHYKASMYAYQGFLLIDREQEPPVDPKIEALMIKPEDPTPPEK